jgi:hypothetical protein
VYAGDAAAFETLSLGIMHLDMIDHLVYGVPDLAQGVDRLEQQTGVRACPGGRHPGRGTHNALMSLGPRQYLEIIALDPEQTDAPGLLFPELRELRAAAFVAWAIAVAHLDEASVAPAPSPERIGPLEGSRARPDGSMLRWKTLRLATDVPLVPFFIAWDAGTLHPSADSPSGCGLTSLQIEHADPEGLRRLLGAYSAVVPIVAGRQSRLTARLATPHGEVELG